MPLIAPPTSSVSLTSRTYSALTRWNASLNSPSPRAPGPSAAACAAGNNANALTKPAVTPNPPEMLCPIVSGSDMAMAIRIIGKVLGTLCACVAAQACVSVDEVQVMPGAFELATPASGFINSEQRARVILKLRAGELCPNGYDRLRESGIVDGQGIETMMWRMSAGR